MVVKYNEPTLVWYKIRSHEVKCLPNKNGVIYSPPIGMINVVKFETITDDFYWFTMTNGKHVGLHICDFTMSSLSTISAQGVADTLSRVAASTRELSNRLTLAVSTATSSFEPFRAARRSICESTPIIGYSVTTYSNNIL